MTQQFLDKASLLNLLLNDSDVQEAISDNSKTFRSNVDASFLILMALHIHIMQYGFACLEAGCVRVGSATNSMWKNCISSYAAAIGFWLVGYAIAFGKSFAGFVGTTYWAFIDIDDINMWFFQYSFCATCTTILSGAIAERGHLGTYVSISFIMSSIYYPFVAHWCWNSEGWLVVGSKDVGYLDFAGSGVIHIGGAAASLAGLIVLPPRCERFNPMNIGRFMGHSTTLASLGCMILGAGFVAFNAGSQLHISQEGDAKAFGLAAANTMLTGAGGMCSVAIAVYIKSRAFPLMPLHCGLLAGCVAACAGCNVMDGWAAVLTGIAAGLVYFLVTYILEKVQLDDPVEAVAVHGGGGITGLIALALLHPDKGVFYQWDIRSAKFLGWQLCGIAVITAWNFAITIGLFYLLYLSKALKQSSAVDDDCTLDEAHGHEPAAPDTAALKYYLEFANAHNGLSGRAPTRPHSTITGSIAPIETTK